jgi:hypothetical protein
MAKLDCDWYLHNNFIRFTDVGTVSAATSPTKRAKIMPSVEKGFYICTTCINTADAAFWNKQNFENSGVSGVVNHYATQHPDQCYEMLCKLHPTKSFESNQSTLYNVQAASSNNTNTAPVPSTQHIDSSSIASTAENLISKVVTFFATEGIARMKARSRTFLDMLRSFEPTINSSMLTDRVFLAELKAQAKEAKNETIATLQNTRDTVVTLGFDGMTNFGDKYIAIELLTVDKNYYWQTINVGKGADTSAKETEEIGKVLRELKQLHIPVHGIVCDNAGNVQSAAGQLSDTYQLIHLGCAAHQLQLMVEAFLGEIAVKDGLIVFDDLIAKLAHQKNSKKLRHILSLHTRLTVVTPNETRWFGRLYSYRRLEELRPFLVHFTSAELADTPTQQNWEFLTDVIAVLESFLEISDVLQSDHNTIWHTYQSYRKINELIVGWSSPTGKQGFNSVQLRNFDWDASVQPVVDKWTTEAKTAMPLKAIEVFDLRKVSVDVGPVTRSRTDSETIDWIKTKGAAVLCNNYSHYTQMGFDSVKANLSNQLMSFQQGQLGFWSYTADERKLLKPATVSHPPVNNVNVLGYWSDRTTIDSCRELATFVCILLRCINTEAAVERNFSGHSIIQNDLRNRLNVEHIGWEMLVRRHNNQRSMNPKLPQRKDWHLEVGMDEYLLEIGELDLVMDGGVLEGVDDDEKKQE